MVQINFAQKQVSAKIVYYGPGMSGKTTNLEVIHQRAPDQNKGELTSISTDGDRTLFFDFMPLDLGTVAGMKTSFQIYTVPGQVYYNSTRKLVLQGVDGVVFVADSSAAMMEENLESLRNLEENLNEYGKSLATLPHVIQFNKRDLPDAMSVDELSQHLNTHGAPCYEAIANTGQGVFPTLKALAARVLETIHSNSGGPGRAAPAPRQPQQPQAIPHPQAPLPHVAHAPHAAPQHVVAPIAAPAAASAQHMQPAVRPLGMQPPPALSNTGFRSPAQPQPIGMAPTAQPPQMISMAPIAPQQPQAHPQAGYAQPPQQALSATGMHPQYQQAPPPMGAPMPMQPQAQMQMQMPAPPPMQAMPPNSMHATGVYQQQAYAQPQVAQPYAQPMQPQANLHMASRAAAAEPSRAQSAPKNLKTGAVPTPLEGTRFRPRNGAANAPRSEPRPTPAQKSSSKLFIGVFVVAGVILAAGLAYVAMSFL